MKRLDPLGRLVAVAALVVACDSGGHRASPTGPAGDGDRATAQANNDFPVVQPVPVTGGPGAVPVPGGQPGSVPVVGGPNAGGGGTGGGGGGGGGGTPTPTPGPTPNPSPTPSSTHTFSTTVPVALTPGGNSISSPLTVSGLTGTILAARFHMFLTTPDNSRVFDIDPLLPIPGTPGHVAIYNSTFDGTLSGANMGTGCPAASSTTFRKDSLNDIATATAPYVGEFHGSQGCSPCLENAFFGQASGYNGTWRFDIIFTGTGTTATLNCWSVDIITSP